MPVDRRGDAYRVGNFAASAMSVGFVQPTLLAIAWTDHRADCKLLSRSITSPTHTFMSVPGAHVRFGSGSMIEAGAMCSFRGLLALRKRWPSWGTESDPLLPELVLIPDSWSLLVGERRVRGQHGDEVQPGACCPYALFHTEWA
ncbi:hypothetical protein BO78DRAFT_395980 [Aspergillus sclerotiicarbonarius CBS 121057]|uniref:Uncharacterized protein n=1 Tax=Aspergillus sclerotiicarbonarius (strain CBS 121057 / IBT 28362) TaxID=1448318 RepID=A0A319ED63_ASPSB|nr:hypothetical protein BO78DRAFT_395980 [Aspergillus sclerotiicarbonarius CBS 121057]